jgi:hypothetical protein
MPGEIGISPGNLANMICKNTVRSPIAVCLFGGFYRNFPASKIDDFARK